MRGQETDGDGAMELFWLTAGALLVASVVALLLGLRRGVPDAGATADIGVYRDQLAEVERDAARGVIPPEEAARLKVEVSRRLLEADRQAQHGPLQSRGALVAVALILLILGGGVWLYERLGAPGYPDMPLAARFAEAEQVRKSRPDQATAEADAPAPAAPQDVDPEFLALMEKLRTAVKARPDDLRGLQLLARNEAQLGRFHDAWQAQEAAIRLKGDAATAADYEFLAQLKIFAAGGYVSPEAEAALTEALRRDPHAEAARYFSGLMLIQTGRPDLAFPLWRDVLEEAGPDSPWGQPIRAEIENLAGIAGVRYTPPEAQTETLKGPDAGAMAAASEMSAEDRAAMVEGMVAQLEARLSSEGGSAEEWARLIGSYAVLGQTDKAQAAWAQAQAALKDQPEALEQVKAAAAQAGVAE